MSALSRGLASVPRKVPFPWIRLRAMTLNSLASSNTRRAYTRALDEFHLWFRPDENGPFSAATVKAYLSELGLQKRSSSTINLQLAAFRKLAKEAEANGLLQPDVAAGIMAVKGVKPTRVRPEKWLTPSQAEQILCLPDISRAKGRRDVALLSMFIGCGLLRAELAAFSIEHIQQREDNWMLVGLIEKGNRNRVVRLPPWAKTAVDRWTKFAFITEGRVFRAINKADRVVSDSMTPQSIFEIVEQYGQELGIPTSPQDLRRTFIKLSHGGLAPLEEIQLFLRHASRQTTAPLLGLQQELFDDHLIASASRYE